MSRLRVENPQPRHQFTPPFADTSFLRKFIAGNTLDAQKEKQWQAFLRKNALDKTPLATVVDDLRSFLLPALAAIAAGGTLNRPWRAGSGWLAP